jgi:hypothetical protein
MTISCSRSRRRSTVSRGVTTLIRRRGPAPREDGMVPVDRAEAVERPGDEEARPTTLSKGTNPLLGWSML